MAAADDYRKTEASSPKLLLDFDKVVREYQARTQRAMSHTRNFLDCVKSRQLPVANEGRLVVEYARIERGRQV